METSARIRAAIAQAPAKMTMQIARELEVPEVEVIRHLPDQRAVELDIQRWEDLLRSFEEFGKVHVIVTNGAATLESPNARKTALPALFMQKKPRKTGFFDVFLFTSPRSSRMIESDRGLRSSEQRALKMF